MADNRGEWAFRGGAARPALRACGLLLAAALGCAAPPAPEPVGYKADFDAPRPAPVASLLEASARRWMRGDLEGALAAAERAREANPRSGAAALLGAELRAAPAQRSGDTETLAEARALLEELHREHPEALAPRLAAARLALADGQRGAAAAEARALVEARPDWAAARVLLSEALRGDDPAEALEQADRAVEIAPSQLSALAARAHARAALAHDGGAVLDARRALRIGPNADLELLLARLLLRRHDARGAVAIAEHVLEAERSPELEIVLARACFASGQSDAALDALARARQRAGADARAEALELEVDLGIHEEHPADACAAVDAARREHPDEAQLAELGATCELTLGRLEPAEASARRAVELAPERPSAWLTLAGVLQRAGARPPALERARASLGAAPDDPRSDVLAGLVAELAGDAAAARAHYEAALGRDAELAVAQLRLARLLAAQGDGARAAELAERARATLGWSQETAEALGLALRAAERPAEAVIALRVAYALVPPGTTDNEVLVVELAAALEAAGEPDEARRQIAGLLHGRKDEDPAPDWLVRARKLRERLGEEEAPPASRPAR